MKVVGIVVDLVVAVALVVTVLLQEARNAGFSFTGGLSSSEQMYGRRRGMDDVLVRSTSVLAAVFFVVTALLAHFW